jgi:hypothetical protein
MQDRQYHIKISPGVINGDIFQVSYISGNTATELPFDPCCQISGDTITADTSGTTFVYSSMTQILTSGPNGDSLLTDLSVPIFLSQNTVDIGYYNVFDGLITQKETMLNFLFSAETLNPYTYYFYNTSDIEFKKYLDFSNYQIDWGDGSPIQTVTVFSPNFYSHAYSQDGEYEISMSGMSPWGYNLIKKTIYVPFGFVPINNPNGTAYFIPLGGSWSATPLMYDYIFSGDSICETQVPCCQFTPVPFLVTGYTISTVNDLSVYGNKLILSGGKFKIGVQVTANTETIGTFWGPSIDNSYTAYTINDIDYYDYSDGTTVFVLQSSGCTDLSCSAITKNEVLMNVISEIEVQSNVFVERGKNSVLERIQRLGEVDSIGDLELYGYGFFSIIKT